MVQKFADTEIATKLGNFNIRVYNDVQGKETIILWGGKFSNKNPPLVRIHSECMTGDTFGSLHCDCGNQLNKSIQLIKKEGGILIYLRQEGRGIGLFEKIKTYQLQSKGHDTFDANVLLGHRPDSRSYEMVKTALDDLGISRIKLLTNNPSKVSDISKLGIEVVERRPLISKANKHNKKYLDTKRKKFQHFLANDPQQYFYQFQIEDAESLTSIIEYLKYKKKDPFLKIGVGIAANRNALTNKAEIKRISSIVKACDKHPTFSPVIHFSFSKSTDILKDIEEIHKIWPSIKRLQLNDWKKLDVTVLKKICKLFAVDVPLSDENFHLVQDVKFRNAIKKNKAFIMLDNSKGKGIKESKESFSQKIDTLLGYGLNDIILCGGFGPDELETYFELRRYYRINFSIDAETNLKTDGKVDKERVKLYLNQLIRFDDPKQEGIEQTRKFLKEHRRTDWDKVKLEGHEFAIDAKVFHAGHFPSSSWFATELRDIVKHDKKFCEVGCGSGVISCLLALANPKLEITATDINPHATENTKLNAKKLGLSTKIKAFAGDVLDSINPKSYFDSIFWALPFGFLDPGTEISLEEAQVFDPGYRAIRKFFKSAKKYLKPKGRLLIGFSSDLGNRALLDEIAKEYSIKLVKIKEKIMKEDANITFEILEGHLIG